MLHSSSAYDGDGRLHRLVFSAVNAYVSPLPADHYLGCCFSAHSLTLHHIQEPLNVHLNPQPMLGVLSTGDLQGPNGLHRVERYSTEERKERIERYRSKRNQRNYHRKITYQCRKTLAENRPRVRGRFARNAEMETEMESAENDVDCFIYDKQRRSSGIVGENGGDCRSGLQSALVTEHERESLFDGDDLLSSFADVFSIGVFCQSLRR